MWKSVQSIIGATEIRRSNDLLGLSTELPGCEAFSTVMLLRDAAGFGQFTGCRGAWEETRMFSRPLLSGGFHWRQLRYLPVAYRYSSSRIFTAFHAACRIMPASRLPVRMRSHPNMSPMAKCVG